MTRIHKPPDTADTVDRSDADLMADLARGDMAALGSIVRRHQHRVRALAYRLTGRWDLADDLAQETFLRVYRSARSYTPSAAFSTWLYRIVVNLCLDQARRPRLAEFAESDDVQPASQAGSDAPLLDRERAQAIQRAIDALPRRQRIALVLHRFEQMTHAQIAQATGWSESAVESLLVRAYARLRQRLKAWMQ